MPVAQRFQGWWSQTTQWQCTSTYPRDYHYERRIRSQEMPGNMCTHRQTSQSTTFILASPSVGLQTNDGHVRASRMSSGLLKAAAPSRTALAIHSSCRSIEKAKTMCPGTRDMFFELLLPWSHYLQAPFRSLDRRSYTINGL